jgi:hypothetical protein
MIHTDDRLLDSPPVPVSCTRCGAKVLARKSSWQQTSVQWDAEATAKCLERRHAAVQPTHGLFLVCAKLRHSIENAARSGVLPIVKDSKGLSFVKPSEKR